MNKKNLLPPIVDKDFNPVDPNPVKHHKNRFSKKNLEQELENSGFWGGGGGGGEDLRRRRHHQQQLAGGRNIKKTNKTVRNSGASTSVASFDDDDDDEFDDDDDDDEEFAAMRAEEEEEERAAEDDLRVTKEVRGNPELQDLYKQFENETWADLVLKPIPKPRSQYQTVFPRR